MNLLQKTPLQLRQESISKHFQKFKLQQELNNLKNNLLYSHKNSQLNCGFLSNMNTGAYRGGAEPPTTITYAGVWDTAPDNVDAAKDRNLSTYTNTGNSTVLHTNSNQNQEIRADWGSSKTFAYTVKYRYRQNGAGADATTYYVEDSTNGSSWNTRDTFVNSTNDTFLDKTVSISEQTFRYVRVRMNINNVTRVRYLDVYEFYKTGAL